MPSARDLGLLEQQPEEVRGVREEPALHVSHLQSGHRQGPEHDADRDRHQPGEPDRSARPASARGASAARRRRRRPTTPPPGSCSPARRRADAPRTTSAEPVWLTSPSSGRSRKIPMPTVRTIRQPPTRVPSVSDVVASSVTQSGALVPVECWVATSITTITPVAFAASFAPCPNASTAELSHWPHAIGRSTSRVARRSATRATAVPDEPGGEAERGRRAPARRRRGRRCPNRPRRGRRRRPRRRPGRRSARASSSTAARATTRRGSRPARRSPRRRSPRRPGPAGRRRPCRRCPPPRRRAPADRAA